MELTPSLIALSAMLVIALATTGFLPTAQEPVRSATRPRPPLLRIGTLTLHITKSPTGFSRLTLMAPTWLIRMGLPRRFGFHFKQRERAWSLLAGTLLIDFVHFLEPGR